MFIDDYSYLENNTGGDNMNMRPMPYMTWVISQCMIHI